MCAQKWSTERDEICCRDAQQAVLPQRNRSVAAALFSEGLRHTREKAAYWRDGLRAMRVC